MIQNITRVSGVITEWLEGGQTYRVTRTNGRITQIQSWMGRYLEDTLIFNYDSAGLFTGFTGHLDTAMLHIFVAEATGAAQFAPSVAGQAPRIVGPAGESFSVGATAGKPATSLANDLVSTDAESASFLQKATIGPTLAEIQALTTLKSKRAWVLDQFKKKLTMRYMDFGYNKLSATVLNDFVYTTQVNTAIATTLIQDPAALRTKATLAMSRLFVLSFPGGAFDDAGRFYSWVSWYDLLDKHVFGNWRDLIEAITYSLHMSRMLTYYANEKESAARQPDENYARELMQLFTIGLWELNRDGTKKLDANGDPIPTYINDDIRQVARTLTGLTRWDFNGTTERYDVQSTAADAKARSDFGFTNGAWLFGDPDFRLQHYLPFYEYGAKKALNGRIDIPEGTDPVTNLKMLHDALFYHPNAGPFFATRMIQHLVTSNPSPAYVDRVAAAFEDNGKGVRGSMQAVWLAILTDPEASSDGRTNFKFGRVRDGFDLWAGQMRSLDRKNNVNYISIASDNSTGTYGGNFGSTFPRMAPSIFGAYDPTHSPPELINSGFLAPEMGMWSDVLMLRACNELVNNALSGEPTDTASATTSISAYSMFNLTAAAADLIERANILLCGGKMSAGLRASIQTVIGALPVSTATEQNNRLVVVLQLILNSPDYWVQL